MGMSGKGQVIVEADGEGKHLCMLGQAPIKHTQKRNMRERQEQQETQPVDFICTKHTYTAMRCLNIE